MMKQKILDVGQCDLDHGSIKQMLSQHFDVEVLRAHSADQACDLIASSEIRLVLVNRLLDRDGSEGLELIQRIKQCELSAAVPVMLVSNFPESQSLAVKLGAADGFGKSALNTAETIAKLRSVLEG